MKKTKIMIGVIAVGVLLYGGVIVARTSSGTMISTFVNSVLLCRAPEVSAVSLDTDCVSNEGTVTIIRSRINAQLQDSAIVLP